VSAMREAEAGCIFRGSSGDWRLLRGVVIATLGAPALATASERLGRPWGRIHHLPGDVQ